MLFNKEKLKRSPWETFLITYLEYDTSLETDCNNAEALSLDGATDVNIAVSTKIITKKESINSIIYSLFDSQSQNAR
jgi:hypothetical protein